MRDQQAAEDGAEGEAAAIDLRRLTTLYFAYR
jgi:hypothetical protein